MRTHKKGPSHTLLAVLLIAAAAHAQQAQPAVQPAAGHPFTAHDWSTLRTAHAVAVSPAGAVLYRVSFGADKGPTQSEWWTIDAAGTQPVKLTLPEGFIPAGYTPDGTALFGGWKVNGQTQLAVFALVSSKAAPAPRTVVLLPRGMDSVVASPDGKRFALVADPRPPDPLDGVRHVAEPGNASLYVVNQDGTGGTWWCPSLSSIAGPPAWRHDGAVVAVLSTLPRIGHHEVATAIDTCSSSSATHVADLPNSVSGLAWDRSDQTLAFLSTRSAVLTPEHVWTVSATGGQPQDRTPALPGTAINLGGDARGPIWVAVAHGVQTDIEQFRNGTLEPAFRWPAGTVEGLPVTGDYTGAAGTGSQPNPQPGPAQIALNIGDPQHGPNVAIPGPSGDLRPITHESDRELATVDLGRVRVVHWKTKDGVALEGIATFPPGYREGSRYPFLVLPHGGPEANDTLELDPFSQTVASLGYVVLQPEYRGSTGYGADFLAAIYQHFGDRAYADVDSATDYAVAQGWADPDRLAIFGWSAGGFMTSWTVTQTNRYKAAIEGAGITDWGPFLWTSDISQIDYDARWTDEDPEAFRKFSAVAFASRVTTPLLILHGEADRRVPTFQGEEFFQILAARKKTVRLVTYPGSPHFPVLWEQRLDIFTELTDWLARYNR